MLRVFARHLKNWLKIVLPRSALQWISWLRSPGNRQSSEDPRGRAARLQQILQLQALPCPIPVASTRWVSGCHRQWTAAPTRATSVFLSRKPSCQTMRHRLRSSWTLRQALPACHLRPLNLDNGTASFVLPVGNAIGIGGTAAAVAVKTVRGIVTGLPSALAMHVSLNAAGRVDH